MNGRGRIYWLAEIVKNCKGDHYQVALDDMPNFLVDVTVCGRMHVSSITLKVGDQVKVELSKYDLGKGRIVWRF